MLKSHFTNNYTTSWLFKEKPVSRDIQCDQCRHHYLCKHNSEDGMRPTRHVIHIGRRRRAARTASHHKFFDVGEVLHEVFG